METKGIYQYIFNQLLEHVKESRSVKSSNYREMKSRIEPMIVLGDEEYDLYQNIVEDNTVAVKSFIVYMIKHMMECFTQEDEDFALRYKNREFFEHGVYDMMLPAGDKKIAYHFMREELVNKEILSYIEKGFDALVIVHMNNYDDFGYQCCITDTNLYNKKAHLSVKHMTLQEFFCDMFGQDEYEIFLEYLGKFNDAAQTIIGYNTVLAPTEDNIEKFKKTTLKELLEFKYEQYVQEGVDPKQIEKIRYNYFERCLYKIMLGDSTFANSFLSSEWNYKIYKATDSLEQTGIIAGYLKSIEQLAYEIAKLHVGERDVTIRKKSWANGSFFTKKVAEKIDFSLGELEYFFVENNNLFGVTDDVRAYIVETVADWRENQRNGYFHKHNLKDINKVDEIRNKAIFLYFLLLGGCKIRNVDVVKLKPYIEKQEDPKDEKQLLEEFKNWIEEIFDYGIPGNDAALIFNLYDVKDYGWAIQLTTIEKKEELSAGTFAKEKFTSGKNLYKWKSTVEEGQAQEYITKIIKRYVDSGQAHDRVKQFTTVGVWCRLGTKIVIDTK